MPRRRVERTRPAPRRCAEHRRRGRPATRRREHRRRGTAGSRARALSTEYPRGTAKYPRGTPRRAATRRWKIHVGPRGGAATRRRNIHVGGRAAAALDVRRTASVGDGRLALSFSGSGLMMAWQCGVAAQLAEGGFMDRVDRVHGTSGGAIAALVLLERPDAFDACLDYYVSGAFFEGLDARDVLRPHDALFRRIVERLDLAPEGCAARLSGRLVAHTTVFDGLSWPRNVAHDAFADDAAVVDAVAASCCIDLVGVELSDGAARGDGAAHVGDGASTARRREAVPLDDGDAHGDGDGPWTARRDAPAHGDGETSTARRRDAAAATPPRRRRHFDGGLSDPMPADSTLPTVEISIFAGGAHCQPGSVAAVPAARPRPHPILRYDWSAANVRAGLDAAYLTCARAAERYAQGRRDGAALLALPELFV
mmetsp:Transcript_26324/g.81015  ORF Transcript_26324/g.81015 Transcript_26324/m.81015 type:complete len:425 (-) Transcript_26324:25-1299(-)